jgi:hypothetical protein
VPWSSRKWTRQDGDRDRLRQLELVCDAIASITLQQLGMDPSRLTDAIEKIAQFNRRHFGARINETNYPTLAERLAFAHEILRWLRGSSGVD